MTRTPLRSRLLALAGAALVAAGLSIPATTAVAADKDSDSSVSVTVPSATPTAPSNPPRGDDAPVPPPAGSPNNAPQGPGGTPNGSPGTGGSGSGSAQPAGPAAPAAPSEPAIAKSPSTAAEQASVDRKSYRPGDTVTVTFRGFTPGEKVQVVLYSEPILIGNVDAGPDGVVSHAFQLPEDLEPGVHTVQLTGWESHKVATASILVAAAPTAAGSGLQGVPVWAWWVGGGLLALVLAAGIWWLVRAMRAPAAEVSAA